MPPSPPPPPHTLSHPIHFSDINIPGLHASVHCSGDGQLSTNGYQAHPSTPTCPTHTLLILILLAPTAHFLDGYLSVLDVDRDNPSSPPPPDPPPPPPPHQTHSLLTFLTSTFLGSMVQLMILETASRVSMVLTKSEGSMTVMRPCRKFSMEIFTCGAQHTELAQWGQARETVEPPALPSKGALSRQEPILGLVIIWWRAAYFYLLL